MFFYKHMFCAVIRTPMQRLISSIMSGIIHTEISIVCPTELESVEAMKTDGIVIQPPCHQRNHLQDTSNMDHSPSEMQHANIAKKPKVLNVCFKVSLVIFILLMALLYQVPIVLYYIDPPTTDLYTIDFTTCNASIVSD